MDLKHNVLFQVSLSNGETFFEDKGIFSFIPGELSPWQRLSQYAIDKKVEITSLSLYTSDGRTFNLPSAGRDPKFAPFRDLEKPLDYNYGHCLAREHEIVDLEVTKTTPSDWFTFIEAIYPDCRLQLWVDENNTKNAWTLLVKNKNE
jgi:hypothetical protein